MKEQYNRRGFLKKAGACLAGSLVSLVIPLDAVSSSRELSERYSYKIPNRRDDLFKEPKHTLLARMLFGEGRGVSPAEKVIIGFTPMNRSKDNKPYTGNTIKESLLADQQYSCFNLSKDNLSNLLAVYDPMKYNKEQWIKCVDLSLNLIAGKYDKWNFGPTHYHLKNINPEPSWVKGMKEKLDSTPFKHQFYIEG